MHANKVDIEGLIFCSGKIPAPPNRVGMAERKQHPELFHKTGRCLCRRSSESTKTRRGWPTAKLFAKASSNLDRLDMDHRRCPSRTFRTRHQSKPPSRSLRSSGDSSNHIVQLTSTPAKPLSMDAFRFIRFRMGPTNFQTLRGGSITRPGKPTEAILTFSNGVTDSTPLSPPRNDAAGTEIHIRPGSHR